MDLTYDAERVGRGPTFYRNTSSPAFEVCGMHYRLELVLYTQVVEERIEIAVKL